MKKGMGLKLGAIILALSLFGCSSDLMEDKSLNVSSGDNQNYGTLVVTNSDRSLDVNTIKNAKVTVSSSDMTDISVDSEVKNGSGTFFFEKIPVGDNRVVTVQAVDENGKNITNWTMRNVIDIKAGSNTVVVDWHSTGLGNVYSELLAKGQKIADFTDTQDSSIKNAVPSALGYYVDSAKIANDFVAGSLALSASYKMSAAKLTYKSAGATGYKITVLDPTSSVKTIASETSGSVDNIAPGKWKVIVTDGTKDVVNKTMTFASGATVELGTLGDPLKGKVIVFVKGTDMNIWAWEKIGTGNGVKLSEVLGGAWGTSAEGKTKMTAATNDYMHDPNGWSMFDYTSVRSGGEICFKLNWSDPERYSGRKTTFWFDGVEYYDTDPTANQLSADASLSSIAVNGAVVEGFESTKESYVCVVSATTETVDVRATSTHENATVEISPEFKTEIAEGASREFVINVTAEDGKTKKTYTVTVKRAKENDTSLASVTVNGKTASSNTQGTEWVYDASGTEDSFVIETIKATTVDANAKVTFDKTSGSVSNGASFVAQITVANGSKSDTYKLTVNYTKKEIVTGEYYWTNKNGAVGTNKTISDWSDWTEAERIVQNAAYDDPRTWKGHQEVSYDAYALYAAYDDSNLYLMVELVNLADNRATFMNHDYAGSDNGWWNNRDCPIGMIFNTGKGTLSKGPIVEDGTPIWGAINFTDEEGFDALFYHSSKYGTFEGKHVGVGTPGYFKTTSAGKFSYDSNYCLSFNAGSVKGTAGITVQYKRQCVVSDKINFESTPTDNRTTSGQDGEALLASETYKAVSTNDLDMSYWYTIPLSTLGIDKAYLESTGISVRQLTPNGGSLMDCMPWDVSMVDVATEPCSDDPSTSHEKEDVDNITSPQARIGKM